MKIGTVAGRLDRLGAGIKRREEAAGQYVSFPLIVCHSWG